MIPSRRLRVLRGLLFGASVLLSSCVDEQATFPQIHRVAGGPDEMFANAYIIEGSAGSIVVDALFTEGGSLELRRRVDELGKPLMAVVVTHGHPDHYGGISQVVAGKTDVPVFAARGVDAVIRRNDSKTGDQLRQPGIDLAEPRHFPDVMVEDGGRLTLGDIDLTMLEVGKAKSDFDTIWIVSAPDGEHAFVGDLVMNGVHAYTAEGHTGRWIESLSRLTDRLDVATLIYPGHGEPGDLELLEEQCDYLEMYRAELFRLTDGQPTLDADDVDELKASMSRFAGHDKMIHWVADGAIPVASEILGLRSSTD